ncbi:S-layer family protein [uncultured Methanobrevibacter sp.]|uniref:beta strand repeat-containing protein n=1 Tax=uncultured Methanobrevibacter sp. TaxID=253161 RepID=UPI0025D71951|nr:right-handed parallel beta-helix repeat-containing protein [uncultured Methanobrevibacter sp.]
MKSKILILFLILCLIMSVSAVSANEVNKTDKLTSTVTDVVSIEKADTNIQSNNKLNDVASNVDSNDDYSVIGATSIKNNITADICSNSVNKQSLSSDNDEILKDSSIGSFSELNTLIKASQVGDVITLNKNYAYNSLTDNSKGVTIAKSITIDGDGYYIDGKNLARAFYIDGNDVTLKNIVIKSTYYNEYGGAIVWNGENGELSNAYIVNSNSTSPSGNLAGGGAIYWSGANGQVKNSRFVNCFATANGGTIAVDAPNFIISGSSFERSTGFRAGGLWFSRLSTNSSVVYCNFTRCVGTQTNSNYGAGALFYQLVNGYINNCRFIQNSGYAAGAIIVPASASGDIYNCYFESNYGRTSGAVVNYDGNLVNCTFVNNWGEIDSCAVKIGNVAVDNCHFSGNYFNGTSNRRGLVYFASSGASISNSRFVNNVVPNYLFFIASNINYVTFDKCNVTGNNVNSVFYATTGSKYSFKNMRITSNTIANVVFQFNDGTEVNLVNNVIQGTYYPAGYTMKTFTPYDTLYVGPSATGDKSGSNRYNLMTFNDALLKINYGGTIYITSGTYEIGTVSFTNYIHFIGDSNKNTIIKNSVITFSTKYTSIKSVDFKNTRVTTGVRGISISNCIFEDFTSTSYLLGFSVAPQCKFTNNIVRNINAPIFNVGNDGDSLLVENVLFDKITSTNALFKYASGNNANNIYKNITVTNSNLDSLVSYYNPSSSNDQKYDEFNGITVKNVIFNGIFFNLKSSTYISHQTLKNFYLENVNAADLFILGKDSKVNNIFLKNVTSASNVFKFSFKTEINNINLTSVNANTVLDFNNVTVIVNKLNLTNVKAGIGFLTSENSQLNNLNLKYSNFTSFMGNLQPSVELKNSVFSDFKGNIKVNGSNVKVVNCNFTRGDVISSTSNGGAIELIKGDNFIIDSCIFKENFANNGGAVYIRSVSNSSYILNSQFHNNIAITNGGAVFVGSGISYYIDSSTRSTFGTTSRNNGLYDLGTIALMHIVWVSSTGTGDGSYNNPASFAKGYESVEPYGFIYFKGETDTFTGIGSFEFNKPGLTFIGNKSTTLNNIPFVMAEYASGYTLYNIIFTGSSSVSAIMWKGKDGLIANCTFKNNGGDNIFRGAAIQVLQNNLKIVNSTFTNNIAGSDEEGYGGAIYCDALNLTVNNCKFSENGVYSRGSHIYLTENASGILINNSQFNNGKIVANVGLGSAIFVLSESNVVISHSKFRNNKALNGGAININGIISILKIYNNEFSNNQASNGGAIAFTSTVVNNLLMYNNVYDSNNVTSKGGAIHSNIKINEKNSNFTKNKANDGGAIYLNVSSNLFNNLLFNENQAQNGGAIFLDSNAAYTLVNNSKFINNKGVGSALTIRAKNITIDYCTFIKNIGLGCGAVDAGADGLIVKNTKFYNNTAAADAGAILFVSATGNMFGYNLTFDGNSATNGGACRISGNNIIILNSIFNNNKATNNGGAVYLYSGSTCNISYCTFLGNNATYGGAVYISIPYTVISNCNFTKNTASLNGGAIYINANNVGVLKSNFINNYANDGSAIYMVSGKSNFEIKESNFNQNIALNHGVIYLTGTTNLRLGGNIFNNNQPAAINEYYYILNSSMFKASKLYVSPGGIGSGLTVDDPIAVDNVWSAIENNGVIVFLQGEYEISKTLSQNYTFVGLDGAIIKRKSSGKYLFVLQNNVILNIANITLNAGVDVVGGSELNLDNVTFVAGSNSDGGIIYETGSKGNIINSRFVGTSNIGDDHIVSVNGNVDINNTEFSNNLLTGSALYYGNSGTGSITNSVFVNNTATNDVRNINIGDISKVTLSENTFDVNLTYNVTNSIYGSLAYIKGNFDAGVNFDIDNVKLIINDTAKINSTVTIDGINHNFSFNITGKLAAGTYNLTVICNDGNVYYLNYSINDFEITKANVTINNINDITVSYGDNDTITITGSIVNNIYSGNNYTGIVSVIIGDNDAINTTVNKNGTFTVNINVKRFDAGIYALNVSVIGNGNYTGNSMKFNSYLTVKNATITVISVDSIIVDYGVKEVIVNGTLNSTKFGDNYTGNITVTIAGMFNITQAVNGTFSVRITNSTPFKVGKYDIIVSGEAITNYNAISSKSFSNAFEVLNVVPNFVISSPSIGYGENATVYIYLPDDATGKVVINASGKYVVVIDDIYGITNATIVLPVSGSYLINATYYGDDNYQGVSANSTLFVERPRSSLNITVSDTFIGNDVLINFTINSAITGEFFDDAFGLLRVYVGSMFYTVNVTNGKANLSVPSLSIASYNVVAIYNGDDNYAGCDGYTNFQVKGYETFLNITLNKKEILVGDNVIVTVKVNETINDDPIYLYVDGKLYNILLTKNGTAVFNVTGLSYGVHNISAVFTATSAFGNVSNKSIVNVIKNNPKFTAEAIANSTNDVFIKFNLPFDATGIINITYNGIVIKNITVDESRVINLGKYSIGNYTFGIIYSGDMKYYNESYSSTVEVGKISDYEMKITSTVIVRNKNVTIFVNLPDEFKNNGTVNLTIDGVSGVMPLINSQVNKTISTVGLDSINVIASYSGFGNYASKTISREFEIKPTDEYVILIIVDDAAVGDNVTINIIAPVEIVNVTLRVDGIIEVINLVDGNGSYNLSNVALGYHTVSVSYDGDDLYYTAKTFYDGFNVTRKMPVINVTADNVTYQIPVHVSVDLGSDDVTGLISIILDGILYNYFELIDGKINFNISSLNAGIHNLSVKYLGDTKYSNITSDIILFEVSKISDFNMDVYYDSKPVVNGSMVDSSSTNQKNIGVELPKDATGNVILYINNQVVGNINTTKILVFTLDDYATGIYNVTVNYTGDKNYNASRFEFKLNVTSKIVAVLEIIYPNLIHVNERFNVTVVNNLDDNAVIVLFVDGIKVTSQLASNNTFIIGGLSSGNHVLSVNFDGNDLYHAGSNSTDINVIKLNSTVSIGANNIDVGENLVVNVTASGNGSATIYIYNETGSYIGEYILSINDGKGQIIVPYKFTEIGEYLINITYNGDNVFDTSMSSTTFIVQLATDYEFKVITTDAFVGENVIVNVTLPSNANNNVILTLPNGTNVTKAAVGGIVCFIISDMAMGDYKVNITYVGDNNYDKGTKIGKFSVYKHDAVIDLSFNTTDKSAVEIIII